VAPRFLSERQDLLREKRIILFSFTAPYHFDATDISKLSAYYALYSKQPAFVDVAARLLYQELTPLGFSPVTIPGTGYDLIEVTSPNPDQVIPLSLDRPPGATPASPPLR
jgi:beta-N-acetylhexosaminidase